MSNTAFVYNSVNCHTNLPPDDLSFFRCCARIIFKLQQFRIVLKSSFKVFIAILKYEFFNAFKFGPELIIKVVARNS